VHLCYVDDSGDSNAGVTYTALLIPDREWSPLLSRWLLARKSIQERFQIAKKTELHAVNLMAGRGYSLGSGRRARSQGSEASAQHHLPRHDPRNPGRGNPRDDCREERGEPNRYL